MSNHPPDKDENGELDDAFEDAESNSNVDPDELDDDLEEEFSLDQLSKAYAEVLQNRDGVDGARPDDPGESGASQQYDAAESDDDDDSGDGSESDEANSSNACPITPETIIESILFVGTPKDVKLNSRKVAAILRDVSPKEVTKMVREINARYEEENAAYRIESDGGVFKMVLDPALLGFQQEYFGKNKKVRLSQSAIDVMAVVAYNQPVTREQVDAIRGKPSGGVLNQLVRRDLLLIEPGKTDPKVKYFSTAERFLDLFNLEEIADLPQTHEVSDLEELAD